MRSVGAVGLLWVVTALLSAALRAATPTAPNIIFILTDDQRHDALGVVTPSLDTPSLNRLAREGMRFSNAFVTTSLCSPSRATILTGLPMREHGVVDNNSALPSQLQTFPMALQKVGYHTAFVGKWHMGGDDARPRAGFDYWVSFPGQGSYGPTTLFGRPSVLNVDGDEQAQQGYITDELTDYALDWLNTRADDAPFMLYLSHKAVHAPFRPAERHQNLYADTPIADATPPPEAMAAEPMWVQNQRNSWHGADFPYHSDLDLAAFRRDYRRTLGAVDDSLGRLLQWVDSRDSKRDTVIVFTSDNGFLFGEHGLIDKRNAYEESMRVPLIVWAPDRVNAGHTEERLVTNLDFSPTLRSLAGAAAQPAGDGRDLTPLFNADYRGPWRESIVYEYYWEFNYPQTPSMFAIRTERYKLIRHHGVWDSDALYDLRFDPGETVNRIADPTLLHLRLRLSQELHQRLGAGNASHSVPYTYKYNQGAVFRHIDGTPGARFPERWMRDTEAEDRYEHFLPDAPDKTARLQLLERAIRGSSRSASPE